MSADDATWGRALEIFQQVSELAPPERRARLAAACAEDQKLRGCVEALLAADGVGADSVDGARLDGGAVRMFPRLLEDGDVALDRWIGRQLGPYRIVRALASGGMGAVFLGERCDGQFEQRVALKVARLGLAGDEAIRRFLAERRILAGLEHPRIARLLDGGVTAEGLPFFAMEYVEGVPITEYCDACGLDVAARLRLFLDVCDAVDAAHRRLVVHRDLKPPNILVTASGGVKLLDFGIAKLLGADEERTRTLDRMLTPAYAAPEQIRGEAITTATDVYALGVVLYELLVGRRPFDGATPVSAATAVPGDEPPAPSTAVRDGHAETKPARRRLRRALRGDLDTILLTALRCDPDRRYSSAEALAQDLRRHLEHRPIGARRDSVGYRLGKFAARHRWSVALAAVLLLALGAALAAAAVQAREKAREARASREVTSFLVRLFEGPDPARARGAELSARELLDQGVERLRGTLTGEPGVRARLLRTIAATYVALGHYDRARPLAEEALRLRRANLPERSLEVADSLDQLGEIRRLEGNYAAAEPLLREALATRQALLPPGDPIVIDSLGRLGRLLEDRGEFANAEPPLRAALDASERRFGEDSTEFARRLDAYAGIQADLGQSRDAIESLRRSLAIRQRLLAADSPEVAASLDSLGVRLDEAGDYREAAEKLEHAQTIRRTTFGADHPLVAATEVALAGVYVDLNRLDEAERTATEAFDLFRRALSADHPKTREALNLLGIVRTERREFAAAVPLYRDLLERYRRLAGAGHPDTLTIENNLAITLLHAGQSAEAERLQRDILSRLPADNGQGTAVAARQNLAAALEEEGDPGAALVFARQALELQRRREGETSGNVAIALRSVAIAEELGGEPRAAERDFRTGLAMGERLAPTHGNATYEWKIPLADLLVGAHRCSEALPLLAESTAELERPRWGSDPIWGLESRLLAARCAPPSSASAAAMRSALGALRALPGVEIDLMPTARALLDGAPKPSPAGPSRSRR